MTNSIKHKTPDWADATSALTRWRWTVGSMENGLAEAGEEWHRLSLMSGAPPTALPMWWASMYEAFGDIDGPVSVHRLYAGPHLVAVLPLSLNRSVCRTWRAYQHPWYTPLWSFAFDNGAKGAGQEIRRHLLTTADALDLKYMLADSECTARLLDGADPARLLVESDPEAADVYNPLDGSWEQCLEYLSREHVRVTKKRIRRLERQGTLAMSVLTGPDNLERTLTECLGLEAEGWKGKKGTAIRCLPKVETFYRGLAGRAAEAGLLAIYLLRLDERLIAFNLCLRTQKRIDALKMAYDEAVAKESPSNVLNYMILEQECQQGRFSGFHWGCPTPFRARWTHCSNRLVRVLLFADTLRGRCSHGAYTRLRPVVQGCREWLKRATGGHHDE
jgi:CelD/BcsL family acetyltransferase involved in cellulose biosynthesis